MQDAAAVEQRVLSGACGDSKNYIKLFDDDGFGVGLRKERREED
jgi:hypothetical protein